jgi:hypothetical protein
VGVLLTCHAAVFLLLQAAAVARAAAVVKSIRVKTAAAKAQ